MNVCFGEGFNYRFRLFFDNSIFLISGVNTLLC